jgi:hypothetical protein
LPRLIAAVYSDALSCPWRENTGLKESIEGVGARKLLEDETGRKIRDCAMNELLTNVGLPGIGCTEPVTTSYGTQVGTEY